MWAKIQDLIKEYYQELRFKVTWPKYEELQGNTVIVLVASLIIAVIIFGVDFAFSKGLSYFYGLFA